MIVPIELLSSAVVYLRLVRVYLLFLLLSPFPGSIITTTLMQFRAQSSTTWTGRERSYIVIDIYVQSGISLALFFGEYLHRCFRAVQVNHTTKSEFKRMNTDDFYPQDKKEYGCEGRKTVLILVTVSSWQLISPQMYWY